MHEALAQRSSPGLYCCETNKLRILSTSASGNHGFRSPPISEIYSSITLLEPLNRAQDQIIRAHRNSGPVRLARLRPYTVGCGDRRCFSCLLVSVGTDGDSRRTMVASIRKHHRSRFSGCGFRVPVVTWPAKHSSTSQVVALMIAPTLVNNMWRSETSNRKNISAATAVGGGGGQAHLDGLGGDLTGFTRILPPRPIDRAANQRRRMARRLGAAWGWHGAADGSARPMGARSHTLPPSRRQASAAPPAPPMEHSHIAGESAQTAPLLERRLGELQRATHPPKTYRLDARDRTVKRGRGRDELARSSP